MYQATRGFEYPESYEVRQRIRNGEKVAYEDREPLVYVQGGDYVDPPSDLLEPWFKRGLIAKVESDPEDDITQ